MKRLAAALLLSLTAAAPAAAADFTAPRSLTGWGTYADQPVAAPGAAAWLQCGDVWLSRGGRAPVRLPAGGAQQLRVAPADGRVTVAWVEDAERVRRSDGSGATTIAGTMARIRTLAATPAAIGWIGVSASNERKVQIATGDGARTPEQGGRPSFGLVGAGTADRALFAWHAEDGPVRRVQLLSVDGDRIGAGRWLTGADGNATLPGVAMGPDGAAVVAWVAGMPEGRIAAAPVAPDGTPGDPQLLSAAPGGHPHVSIGADGTAVVAWPAQGGGVETAVRRPGEARFGAPVTFAPGSAVTGYSAGVSPAGDVVVAFKDGERTDEPRGGGLVHAAVAPAGEPFGQPAVLDEHVFALAGAAATLTWVQGRPQGEYEIDRRVRTASLLHDVAPGQPDEPGATADRAAPKLRLKVLSVRGRRVRISVRSSERAALRATWKRGARTLRRAGGTLRAGRTKVLALRAPAGARRVTLTVRATDAAGNTRSARRTVRLRQP
ncbi:MAG TPA: hypothetical protein VFN44_04280 [Solirubrobacteraceae bacterium]|nr:hypothetical protein [Solirubrobacteraceae bacterium]